MIVDRIYEYLGGPKGAAAAAQEHALLDAAVVAFRRTLVRNFLEDQKEERRRVSPSSAWYCGRRMLYACRGAEREATPPRSSITFAWGDVAEAMGLLLARVAGVPLLTPGLDGVQQEVQVPVGDDVLVGHMDATVEQHGAEIPVDFKSMSDMGFGEFERAVRDPNAAWWQEHRWDIVTQVRLYMRALEAKQGRPVHTGIVVAVNKNTGHMAELHVPRDEQHLALLDGMMRRLRQHEQAGTLPARPEWAKTLHRPGDNLRADGTRGAVEELTAWRCGYCPFVRSCWEGFALVPLKAKPAWRRPV